MNSFNNISTNDELAHFLGIPLTKLNYIIFVRGIDQYYKTFDVPKKNGEPRHICASTGALKTLQHKLSNELWIHQKAVNDRYKRAPNISHAFERGKNIITNAKIHRNKKLLINIDLKDFFDSIHFGRVCGYFENNRDYKLPHEVAMTMARLVCYKGKLPQGAPTSPIITNLICHVLDMHLLSLAKKYKLDYTRYADDLTFSTNYQGFVEMIDAFYNELKKEILRAGFLINEEKTRIIFHNSKQVVTGLVVNNKISVDHNYCREIRAMAHSIYKNGFYTTNGIANFNMRQLEGRFAFINQIEKYNNKNDISKKHNAYCLNGREKQYQKFLFYRYFYNIEKPLIITEGKTDVRYIKAALMSMSEDYPELVSRDEQGKFIFKVKFFRRTKRLRYFFDIALDGADAVTKLYKNFFDSGKNKVFNYYSYFSQLSKRMPENPVILIYDNEISVKDKPLKKFAKEANLSEDQVKTLKMNLFLQVIEKGNLFVATTPLSDGITASQIEDMFRSETRNVIIQDKTLSLEQNYDKEKHFGKEIFSKYVLENYVNIDFSGFKPFLNVIKSSIRAYELERNDIKL